MTGDPEQPRIPADRLGTVLDSVEPCENCGTPVVMIAVEGTRPEGPRLYEVSPDRDDPFLMHMTVHTPAACRARRGEEER
jgi:hypothetical protein